MELVNKLYSLEFLCVELDSEAHDLFKYYPDLRASWLHHVSTNNGFISFRRMEALETYENTLTVENHHIVMHWHLVDNMVYHLTKQNPDINKIYFILGETLKCAKTFEDIKKDIDAMLKKEYNDLREVA
jgi:hypothetical protein